MRAGTLKYRGSIQKLTQTRTAGGELGESWAHATWCHAAVTPLSGEELLSAQQQEARTSHRIDMRPYAQLDPRIHRFQFPAPGRVTTLAAAIESVDGTEITVSAAGLFPEAASPPSGGFDVRIEDEILTVSAGHGTTTWTVTRGVHGTTAAVHDAARPVELLRTLYPGAPPQVAGLAGEAQAVLCREVR